MQFQQQKITSNHFDMFHPFVQIFFFIPLFVPERALYKLM